MTALEIFGVAASFASIASLIFAAFVYHRDRLRQAREEGNVAVLRERIRGIANSLNTTTIFLQQLIRQADDPETPVRELQNMARGVRAGLLGTFMDAKEMTAVLSQWKVGQLLESHPLQTLKEQETEETPAEPREDR